MLSVVGMEEFVNKAIKAGETGVKTILPAFVVGSVVIYAVKKYLKL